MTEGKRLYCLGDPLWFFVIDREGPPRFHRAVMTPSGANVAEDQKGGRARVPAFPAIGTAGFFADRMQLEPFHRLLDVEIVLAGLGLHLEPGWEPGTADSRSRPNLIKRDEAHG